MASFDDLGRALRDDAAANAPTASVIDVDAVTHAARARRRPRQWAVGTLAVVAAVGFGGLAVSAVTPPALIAASESADSSELLLADESAMEQGESGAAPQSDEATRAQPVLECGGMVPPAGDSADGLRLEASLPLSFPARGETLEGVITLTNTGASAVSVSTRPAAGGVLLRDGLIVGTIVLITDAARVTELLPGASLELPLRAETLSCTTGGPLAPGEYTVLSTLDLTDPSSGTATSVVAEAIPVRLD